MPHSLIFPSSSPPLAAVLTGFTSLARERGADMTYSIQLGLWGCEVNLFWDNALGTGKGSIADMPRQAVLAFSIETDPAGAFQGATVICPHVWCWATDEGLDEEAAHREATRVITTLGDLEDYLCARPYRHVHSQSVVDKGR